MATLQRSCAKFHAGVPVAQMPGDARQREDTPEGGFHRISISLVSIGQNGFCHGGCVLEVINIPKQEMQKLQGRRVTLLCPNIESLAKTAGVLSNSCPFGIGDFFIHQSKVSTPVLLPGILFSLPSNLQNQFQFLEFVGC